jgi:hypothetical protein
MNDALDFTKSITEEELSYISQADRGEDIELHKAALRKLIFEQECIVNKDQYWHPYECVELNRWICEQGHEREFAICNIIIALSTISGADITNDPDYMLDIIADEYDELPTNMRELVLSCLISARHAYNR